MIYKVEFTKRALKDLKKLDRHTAALILGWIRKNLENCENPRSHGKGLTANRSGEWRYRVGDYRILAQIDDNKIIILLLNIGEIFMIKDPTIMIVGLIFYYVIFSVTLLSCFNSFIIIRFFFLTT